MKTELIKKFKIIVDHSTEITAQEFSKNFLKNDINDDYRKFLTIKLYQ
jgi:hypothetical protein